MTGSFSPVRVCLVERYGCLAKELTGLPAASLFLCRRQVKKGVKQKVFNRRKGRSRIKLAIGECSDEAKDDRFRHI
jgi:hypothetical protein